MELKFKSILNKTQDISLYEFEKIVDKNFDYINGIEVVIHWNAMLYTREYGITENITPHISKVELKMNYEYIKTPQTRDSEGELVYEVYDDKDYTLVIDDFLDWDHRDNEIKAYSEKKWVIKEEMGKREEFETHLYPISIDIDFETKKIDVEF